ncbi:hypothetical protein N7452_001374 [Penicillium brevicompactum]|uniref:Uncharacterized protein n=1 Tax=Penicillium brevicompactum TaxID=5074 RepID=A0A9W9R2F1_PENBR|nr:hypothetical protein N7452_001374 [Penicillium brevicompactum]
MPVAGRLCCWEVEKRKKGRLVGVAKGQNLGAEGVEREVHFLKTSVGNINNVNNVNNVNITQTCSKAHPGLRGNPFA